MKTNDSFAMLMMGIQAGSSLPLVRKEALLSLSSDIATINIFVQIAT